MHLPPELVMLVLEHLYYNATGQVDRRTLAVCAQLCKSWAATAQPLLFRHICIPALRHYGEDRMAAFRSSVFDNSERPRTLAAHVRRADVTVWDPTDVQSLVDTVQHCPHLYELTLRVHGALHELPEPDMDALGSPTVTQRLSPIRALLIPVCGIQSPIMYQLLHIWPTVRFLRMGTEVAAAPPPNMTMRARLYEIGLVRTPCIEGMAWLLAGSRESLRIFQCHAAPLDAHGELLAAHAPELHSLRLFRHTLGTRALLQHCGGLRELMLTQVSDYLSLGELPKSIEHISFRHFAQAAVPPAVIRAIEELPKLRLVSCDASVRRADGFAALAEACSRKGVVLSHDVVPIRVSEDPIPLMKFPRGRTVDNLRYMNPGVQEG